MYGGVRGRRGDPASYSIHALKEEKMLLYQTSFSVTGLEDSEKVDKLKKALFKKEGVTKVEITRPNKVTVTYNPRKIIPSVLNSIISSLGFNPPRG